MSDFIVELLAAHDRASFTSGSDELDRYFRERVGQDIRRRLCACFVAVAETGDLGGFYTLAATSLAFDALSPERAKRLPRYPVVPAILLGRLAISRQYQGKGLGGALVADALMRSARSEIVGHALVVDAKDEPAERFYLHLGFEPLAGRRLIRPL